MEPEAQQIADALISYYDNAKESEFTENVKVEKQNYAWSKMTGAIQTLATELEKPGNYDNTK